MNEADDVLSSKALASTANQSSLLAKLETTCCCVLFILPNDARAGLGEDHNEFTLEKHQEQL